MNQSIDLMTNEKVVMLNEEDVKLLLKYFDHEYVSYENEELHKLLKLMSKWYDELAKQSPRSA